MLSEKHDMAKTKVDNTIVVIGPFQVLAKIGEGGMGKVYKVLDTRNQTVCALKVIENQSDEFFARFVLEAKSLANLIHPNIVRFYEFSKLPNRNQYYLLMQYIDGKSLDEVIDNISITKAIEILIEVLHAIHYVHINNFIHRDIKPANILIDNNGKPYVMDFGIAKVSDNKQGLTQKNVIMGTPAYMSPEQISGEENIDCRTDVYSLGVILYQMLTRQLPFGETISLVMMNLSQYKQACPQKLNPKITDTLDQICQKALAFNRNARYQNAKEFVDDLEVCAKEHTIFRKRSERNSSISPSKKNNRKQITVIIVTFILVTSASLFLLKSKETPNKSTTNNKTVGNANQEEKTIPHTVSSLESITFALKECNRVLQQKIIKNEPIVEEQEKLASLITHFSLQFELLNVSQQKSILENDIVKWENIEKNLDNYFNSLQKRESQDILSFANKEIPVLKFVEQYLSLKEVLYRFAMEIPLVNYKHDKALKIYDTIFKSAVRYLDIKIKKVGYCPVKQMIAYAFFIMKSKSFLQKDESEVVERWNTLISGWYTYIHKKGNHSNILVLIFLNHLEPCSISVQLDTIREEYISAPKKNFAHFIRALRLIQKSLYFIKDKQDTSPYLVMCLPAFTEAIHIYHQQKVFSTEYSQKEILMQNLTDDDDDDDDNNNNVGISAESIISDMKKDLLTLMSEIDIAMCVVNNEIAQNLITYNKQAFTWNEERKDFLIRSLEATIYNDQKKNIAETMTALKKTVDVNNAITYQTAYCKKYLEGKK